MGDLSPSSSCELGKKEYWKDFYATELENFEGFKDVGEIWFGMKNNERIVNWAHANCDRTEVSILDVGCGNGMTLVSLVHHAIVHTIYTPVHKKCNTKKELSYQLEIFRGNEGFSNLTGVDYAEEAIALAKEISEDKEVEMNLYAVDFLEHSFTDTFDVIIDKGTYDAICLDIENAPIKRKKYSDQVHKILDDDGYFLIFSCNFTSEELLGHFEDFYLDDEIPIPSISFGGQTGQTVTALVLCKKLTS